MGIYQELWTIDQQGNGVQPLTKSRGHSGSRERGYVIVDEREATTRHAVLAEVVIPTDKHRTYDLCEQLWNNYRLDPGLREDVTRQEAEEENAFIDAILSTRVLQHTREFLGRDRGVGMSDSELAMLIKSTWFYQGRAGSKSASGFEHVFVGEQKPKGDAPDREPVTMGGYHFWYKFHIDEGGSGGDDRIRYHGTRYANLTEQGILVPEIVTLSFEWDAPDHSVDGRLKSQRLRKPIGGFWVGCSPEALIAYGLVRVHSSAGSQVQINSSTYKLEFFPLSDQNRSIRTLFPRFLRTDIEEEEYQEPETDKEPEEERGGRPQSSDRKVHIIAALVNPSGEEAGRESVSLLNSTATGIDLDGWKLQAPNGWTITFSDVTIASGDCRRILLPSAQPQLRNRGGIITLLDAQGDVHDRVTYKRDQAAVQDQTIVF